MLGHDSIFSPDTPDATNPMTDLLEDLLREFSTAITHGLIAAPLVKRSGLRRAVQIAGFASRRVPEWPEKRTHCRHRQKSRWREPSGALHQLLNSCLYFGGGNRICTCDLQVMSLKAIRCSSHSSGNGCIAFAIVNPSCCLPACIASTISGASNVIRSRRLT